MMKLAKCVEDVGKVIFSQSSQAIRKQSVAPSELSVSKVCKMIDERNRRDGCLLSATSDSVAHI